MVDQYHRAALSANCYLRSIPSYYRGEYQLIYTSIMRWIRLGLQVGVQIGLRYVPVTKGHVQIDRYGMHGSVCHHVQHCYAGRSRRHPCPCSSRPQRHSPPLPLRCYVPANAGAASSPSPPSFYGAGGRGPSSWGTSLSYARARDCNTQFASSHNYSSISTLVSPAMRAGGARQSAST
jgi:hypothetical protein